MNPKGTLIIVGGAEDKGEGRAKAQVLNSGVDDMEILKELLPADVPKQHLEVITTASEDPEEVKKNYRRAFHKLGYENVGFHHIEERPQASNKKLLKALEKAHTVFFSGGDQFRLSTIIGGTPVSDLLNRRYVEDKDFVLAGTSAGAMAMSKVMIQSGGTWEALFEEDIQTSAGLGLLQDCIIDTHFIRRGRFGRLAHAVIVNPGCLGIGLGEDTALIIRKGFEAECFGSGMVVIIDGRNITHTNVHKVTDDYPIYVENLKVHLLVKGCRFHLKEVKLIKEPKAVSR